MNRNEFIEIYWRYYEALENDFINTIRYVSLDESNYSTYSIEYARLLQTICSEVDVLMKEYCRALSPSKKVQDINDYANVISEKDRGFMNESIFLKKYARDLKIIPFATWEMGNSPKWWKCYNNVKHQRNQKMKDANQKNVLYSLAGLYLLEMKMAIRIRRSETNLEEWMPHIDEPAVLFYDRLF